MGLAEADGQARGEHPRAPTVVTCVGENEGSFSPTRWRRDKQEFVPASEYT